MGMNVDLNININKSTTRNMGGCLLMHWKYDVAI